MKYCLTFLVRYRSARPIHFCFDSEDEAVDALREFAGDIDRADAGEIVFVNRRTGFLKNCFISVQMDPLDNDNGEEDDEDDDPDVPEEPDGESIPAAGSMASTKPLESALEAIVRGQRRAATR